MHKKQIYALMGLTACTIWNTSLMAQPAQKTPKPKKTPTPQEMAERAAKRRTKTVEKWQQVLGVTLDSSKKSRLSAALQAKETADKKFQSDLTAIFGLSKEQMKARRKAYSLAHPPKPKSDKKPTPTKAAKR